MIKFEAIQFTGMNFMEIIDWANGTHVEDALDSKLLVYAKEFLIDPDEKQTVFKLVVKTPMGQETCRFGDYFIRTNIGIHLCGPTEFEEHYGELLRRGRPENYSEEVLFGGPAGGKTVVLNNIVTLGEKK